MMDTLFYIFAVLVFAAVILLIEGAYLWWSDHFGSSAARTTCARPDSPVPPTVAATDRRPIWRSASTLRRRIS